jgi:hypothetical protein
MPFAKGDRLKAIADSPQPQHDFSLRTVTAGAYQPQFHKTFLNFVIPTGVIEPALSSAGE